MYVLYKDKTTFRIYVYTSPSCCPYLSGDKWRILLLKSINPGISTKAYNPSLHTVHLQCFENYFNKVISISLSSMKSRNKTVDCRSLDLPGDLSIVEGIESSFKVDEDRVTIYWSSYVVSTSLR